MKKLNILAIGGAGVIVGLGGFWLSALLNLFDMNPKTPTSAPVVVRGGSVHGLSGGAWNSDTSQGPGIEYISPVKNNRLIYTYSIIGASPKINDNRGWVINFYDKKAPNGNPAVMLCSDESCDHQSVDQNHHLVYIRARPDSMFEQYQSGELRFHNLSPNCDDYPKSRNETPTCDDPGFVGIISGGAGGTETKYPCGTGATAGKCFVFIGKPSS